MSETVEKIRAWHRKRCFVMETRKRADLALGSSLRSWLGWRRDLPKADSDRIKALADELITCGEKLAKGKPHELSESSEWSEFGEVITAAVLSRAPVDTLEAQATKEMEKLAKTLPVWESFAKHVRGFGALSLAVIVGEAGDLSNYSDHSKLWKRMGLAVIDGLRQGGLSKNAKAEEWIKHGYNRQRRARVFVIGDVLIKSNGDGPYRTAYLERKEYERSRAEAMGLKVAPAAKIPAKRQHEFISDGHIHRRAQRYMEKRLLKHLWQAWRRATIWLPVEQASNSLPVANKPKRRRRTKATLPTESVATGRGPSQAALHLSHQTRSPADQNHLKGEKTIATDRCTRATRPSDCFPSHGRGTNGGCRQRLA